MIYRMITNVISFLVLSVFCIAIGLTSSVDILASDIERAFSLWSLQLGADGGPHGVGAHFSLDLFNLMLEHRKIKNLGLKTSLAEGLYSSSTEYAAAAPNSILPLYIYYPFYFERKEIDDETSVRSPFVYAFAGGSMWGASNNYLHLGITWFFSVTKVEYYEDSNLGMIQKPLVKTIMTLFPVWHYKLQVGLLSTPNNIFNLYVAFGTSEGELF